MELMDLLFLEPKAIESINAMDPIGPLAAPSRMTPRRSSLISQRAKLDLTAHPLLLHEAVCYTEVAIDSRLEAVGFYEKLGYKLVGDDVVKSGAFKCVQMRKSLASS